MQFLLSRVQDKNDDTGILLDILMMLTALQMPDMALCHMHSMLGSLLTPELRNKDAASDSLLDRLTTPPLNTAQTARTCDTCLIRTI